jgi:hypothetical protein
MDSCFTITTSVSPLRYHHFNFIDEAPAPILPGLKRGNDRMPGCAGMLTRVTIFRVVAAANMTARAAQAQMHPRVAHCQAFHAAVAGGHDAFDAVQMSACLMTPAHCPASRK